jgi:hypothetical protein
MKKFKLDEDLTVFGVCVENFPVGVGEAFDRLVKEIPEGFARPYYGISWIGEDGKIVYYATALEKQEGEAEQYNCERHVIEKGDYLAVAVQDWRQKTHTIKDVFAGMLQGGCTGRERPCVEWYKNNDEMLCMLRAIEQD